MIPRKSTIKAQNLAKIHQKCVKKFIFSKFAGLLAYSRQPYYQMFFDTILSPPCSPMYWLKPPLSNFEEPSPMFSTPVGNPVYSQFYEKWVSFRERNIKFLLEIVTYIATTETDTWIITIKIAMCIMHCRKEYLRDCNRDSYMHNFNRNCHPRICCRNFHLHKFCRNF